MVPLQCHTKLFIRLVDLLNLPFYIIPYKLRPDLLAFADDAFLMGISRASIPRPSFEVLRPTSVPPEGAITGLETWNVSNFFLHELLFE
jgi:hypothetical protein